MAKESLEMRVTLKADPKTVYRAWLDSKKHSAFTGGEATVDARVGGRHTAWDGYIEGEILELEPGERIVLSWRSTDFSPRSKDSKLELTFQPYRGGTRLILRHTDLPKGTAETYRAGWAESYFEPMKNYFAIRAKKAAAKKKAALKKKASGTR